MGGVRWFGFRGKLIALIGLATVGSVTLGVIRTIAIDTVKVEGPLYQQITRDKDLINDLTPPRLFIREPHTLLQYLAVETDPARQQDLIDRFHRAQREYERSYEEWERKLADGPVKTTLRDETHQLATEFFAVAEREFI